MQGFFKDFNKGLRRTTFSIAFCSIPTFAERHPTIASKAKYETEIQNSAKCLSVYEKMKKNAFPLMKKYNLLVILPPKPFLTRRINKL